MEVDSKTILCMVARYFGLKRDTTEERLKLQKTIYLLQSYGLNLGYGFSWYKYGPYSQDLVQDAYDVLRSEKLKYEYKTRSLKFNKHSQEKFEEFKKICKDILNDNAKLEVAASLYFIRQTWCPTANDEELIQKFKELKKRLFGGRSITEDMINGAVEICRELKGSRN